MRGLVAGLPNPHPLARGLPGIYQEEDEFAVRLTEALDASLAPIVSTLDNLAAYFDPRYAPEDFLGWLAGWVGIELDETWDIGRRRTVVAKGAELLRQMGTRRGLAAEVELATGGRVDIVENGGSRWSREPGGPMVGSPVPSLVVRVHVADPGAVDRERLDRLIAASKPAHVPHRLEIAGSDVPGDGDGRRPTPRPGPRPAPAEGGQRVPRTDGGGPVDPTAGDATLSGEGVEPIADSASPDATRPGATKLEEAEGPPADDAGRE
jgi:phage tail-like protein